MNHAKSVLQTLNEAGFQAYFVGGAVRDLLLGLDPKDYDITTNASMKDIENCFEKSIRTGERYGTVTVFIENERFEVTTFRGESDYNGRAPEKVFFVESLREDLARRDFTINAMAMDYEGNVYDYFSGQDDLKKRVIRFVGCADDRLKEDRLRIFRLVRFAQRYGMTPIENFRTPVDIAPVSVERIQKEFNEMLLSTRPSNAIRRLLKYGILDQFLPEIMPLIGFNQKNPHHQLDVFEHTMVVLDESPAILEVRLAALCHDLGKPETFKIDEQGVGHFYGHHSVSADKTEILLKRLKYNTHVVETVKRLVHHHMLYFDTMNAAGIKRMIRKIGKENFEWFLMLLRADRLGTFKPDMKGYECFVQRVREVLEEDVLMSVKDLDVDGHALMALGFEGKAIGTVLKQLLEAVTENQVKNEYQALMTYVKTHCM